MLRERLIFATNGYPGTPKTHNLKEESQKPIISERKFAVFGLVFSLCVVAVKIYVNHHEAIEKAFLEQKLESYEVLTEDGQVMLEYAWKTVVKYSRFWLPALTGFIVTYCTWIMVYLDSNVPGIQPPSPLSPKKYRMQSGHTFHSNYVFAVLIGVITFFYMLFTGVEIKY